jgi:hypothetical protein
VICLLLCISWNPPGSRVCLGLSEGLDLQAGACSTFSLILLNWSDSFKQTLLRSWGGGDQQENGSEEKFWGAQSAKSPYAF